MKIVTLKILSALILAVLKNKFEVTFISYPQINILFTSKYFSIMVKNHLLKSDIFGIFYVDMTHSCRKSMMCSFN